MTTKNNGISIIIPVYNVEKYLRQCLDSVVNQNFDKFEIIIVNDGSTDGSEKICKEYMQKYDNITYIKTENHGLSAARNTGLKKTKYEYVWFVDSDDYIDKNSLNKISPFFGHDIIVIEHLIFQDGSDAISLPKYTVNKNPVKRYLLNLPAAPFKILKKSLLDRIDFHFEEGRLFEDFGSMYSLVKYTEDICFTDERLYYCRRRSGSITHNTKNIKNEDRFWAADQVLDQVPNTFFPEKEYIITKHIAIYMSEDMVDFKYKTYVHYMDQIRNYLLTNVPNFRNNKYIKKGSSLKDKAERYYLYCIEKRRFRTCRMIASLRRKIG